MALFHLQQLTEATPSDHADKTNVEAALSKIKLLAEKINERVAHAEVQPYLPKRETIVFIFHRPLDGWWRSKRPCITLPVSNHFSNSKSLHNIRTRLFFDNV